MPAKTTRTTFAALCILAWIVAFAGIRFASLGI